VQISADFGLQMFAFSANLGCLNVFLIGVVPGGYFVLQLTYKHLWRVEANKNLGD